MKLANKYFFSPYSIFLVHVAILFLYHVFGYVGHYGYDDLEYANIAANFNQGNVDFENHFTFRFPVILFTALSYSIFGVNDFASSLPAIILTTAILWMVFKVLKDKGNIALSLGLSFTLFSNWFIFYSDKLMPDIYVAFGIVGAVMVYYNYLFEKNHLSTYLSSLVFVFFVFFGFASKGTIILVFPLLLYFFLIDVFIKKKIIFWVYAAINAFALLVMYFSLTYYLTGNLFERFTAISRNSYLNSCSYDQQPIIYLVKRLAYELINLFTFQGMVIGVLIALIGFVINRNKRILLIENTNSFFMVSSLILFMSCNFMTISITSYSPMCLDPRHYLFIVPITGITSGLLLKDFVETKRYKIWYIIGLAMLVVLAYFLEGNAIKRIYIPLLGLFVLYSFLKPTVIIQKLFCGAIILVLCYKPFDVIKYSQQIQYAKQRDFVYENLLSLEEPVYVITNDVQARLGIYYSGFKKNNVQFLPYHQFNIDTLQNRPTYLLLNKYTLGLSGDNEKDLPFYAQLIDSSYKVIVEDKSIRFSLYKVPVARLTLSKGESIIHSINHFERDDNYWTSVNTSTDTEKAYQGEKYSVVDSLSTVFSYSLDSISLSLNSSILIQMQVMSKAFAKTSSKLVLSISNQEGEYIRHQVKVNKFIKAYAGWWPVKNEYLLKEKEILPHSTLRVMMTNAEQDEICIDNFEIKMTSLNNKSQR